MTPPRRIEIGSPSLRWRVTDPDAPVDSLQPAHPGSCPPQPHRPQGLERLGQGARALLRLVLERSLCPPPRNERSGREPSRRSDFRRDRQGPSYSCEPRAPSSTRQARSRGLPAHRQLCSLLETQSRTPDRLPSEPPAGAWDGSQAYEVRAPVRALATGCSAAPAAGASVGTAEQARAPLAAASDRTRPAGAAASDAELRDDAPGTGGPGSGSARIEASVQVNEHAD